MQVLRGLDEAEMHSGLVPGAQTVLVHAQNGSRLPDAPTVHCQESQGGHDRTELPSGLRAGDAGVRAWNMLELWSAKGLKGPRVAK